MLTIVEAYRAPRACACRCHEALTLDERTQAIAAMLRFDDAMRGWNYTPLYEIGADRLYREAQRKNDRDYRGIAVRDEDCLFQRLVGFAVHETLHALQGDPSRANYGIPFGLPYGVPLDVPEGGEAEFLAPFNLAEARAWVGVAPLGRALFGIDWPLRTARDVGTYGFVGGNAIVEVPDGYRAVPHVDRNHHPRRYYALARKLEDEAASWFTDEKLRESVARFEEAEARGKMLRRTKNPDPRELARIKPVAVGRNELCSCGSGKKLKKCCGAK